MDTVKCKRGENFAIQMVLRDSSGALIDLSSYSAKYGLKKRQSELETDYIVSPDDVDMTIESLGTISGNIPPSITNEIPAGTYIEEIEIYTSDGEYVKKFARNRVVEPRVVVSTPVTPPPVDPPPVQ